MQKTICIEKKKPYYITMSEDPENGIVVQLAREVVFTRKLTDHTGTKHVPGKTLHHLHTEKVYWTETPGITPEKFKARVQEAIRNAKTELKKREAKYEMVAGVFQDYVGREVEMDWAQIQEGQHQANR